MLNLFSSAEKDTKDQKSMVSVPKQISKIRITGSGKHNTTAIILVTAASSTSGAAAAQAPVIPVQPGASAEFSSLAILFDEFICDKLEFIWNISVANSQTNDIDAAIAYDPINTGAYTSVLTVLEASQHHGPMQMGQTAKAVSPNPLTQSGFWRKTFVFPKGPSVQDPNATSRLAVGQWTSTGVATTNYGNVKGYVTAASSGATTFSYYMRMFCRFRQRS